MLVVLTSTVVLWRRWPCLAVIVEQVGWLLRLLRTNGRQTPFCRGFRG